MRTDPSTPAEWQDAVDAANALMVLESARQYGLVTGGPEVDLGRCVELLAAGLRMGIRPNRSSPARYVEEWNAEARLKVLGEVK